MISLIVCQIRLCNTIDVLKFTIASVSDFDVGFTDISSYLE